MRWDRGRRSDNIEDRRGAGGGTGFPSGRMPGRIGIPRGRAGAGGLGLIAVVVVALLLGVDPSQLLQGNFGDSPSAYLPQRPAGPEEERLKDFVSVVLADTEDTWHEQFRSLGSTYEEPRLVLFSGGAESGCGFAQSAMGPFYCPARSQGVSRSRILPGTRRPVRRAGRFCRRLRDRTRGRASRAEPAGHHGQGGDRPAAVAEAGADSPSVRLELQADCFAGVWARNADQARHILEAGDIEEAMQAAAAVGDDRLQRKAQGYAVPDSFTHGTSEQRVRWFKRGFDSGQVAACDTFNASRI